MARGIALQFAKKFPDRLVAQRSACKAGEVQPARMHVYERQDNPRTHPPSRAVTLHLVHRAADDSAWHFLRRIDG
jgi:hypothetical protein